MEHATHRRRALPTPYRAGTGPSACLARPSWAQDFGRQLLQAVSYMHELRLVHTGVGLERRAAPSRPGGCASLFRGIKEEDEKEEDGRGITLRKEDPQRQEGFRRSRNSWANRKKWRTLWRGCMSRGPCDAELVAPAHSPRHLAGFLLQI
jgi:hypothetical protein